MSASPEGRNRLLILNVEVSGMNRHLYAALSRAWQLTVVDVPRSRVRDAWGKVVSVRPTLNAWRRRLDLYQEQTYKSAAMFRWRTRRCEQVLQRRYGSYDLVLQVSSMYAPWMGVALAPHVVLTSYTLKLAERAYREWAPFRSARAAAGWYALEEGLYRRADRVLTTTEHARRSIIRDYGVAPELVSTVGYGIPLEPLPSHSPLFDGRTILFVGKDFHRKGGFVLLEAFARIRRDRPGARLVIVGPNPDRIARNDPGVVWLGEVRDRARLDDLYRQAHVLAIPSLCEPFGLVLVEAMAHGLPCVATTVDAMAEIVEDGVTGFLVPPADPITLADRLTTLLDDSPRAQLMGARGRTSTTARFTWDKMADRISEGLRSVLDAYPSTAVTPAPHTSNGTWYARGH